MLLNILSPFVFTERILLSVILGAAIGIERQWRQKSGGLRTNTLVSLGSAAFVLLAADLGGDAPARIASYIVSGIGFLGAGVIMKDGMSVQGLNTAATIWCSAAIGSLAGLGFASESIIVTVVVVLVHLLLRPLSSKLGHPAVMQASVTRIEYLMAVKCSLEVESHVRMLMMQFVGNDERLLLCSLSSTDAGDTRLSTVTAQIRTHSPQENLMERMAGLLTIEQQVVRVSWEVAVHSDD